VTLYLGADVEHRRWRLVTPGAVLALVAWLAASGGLAFYSARFGSFEKTWGTLSAVVVTLLWLWLAGAALLFGAEVDAQVRRRPSRQ
jgi:membrane protein